MVQCYWTEIDPLGVMLKNANGNFHSVGGGPWVGLSALVPSLPIQKEDQPSEVW